MKRIFLAILALGLLAGYTFTNPGSMQIFDWGLSYTPGTPPNLGGLGDPTIGLLQPPRSAWVNWQKAGLLSLGGIPSRTGVCNSGGLNPIGGGSDDTTAIQSAINNCATPCTTYASTNACVVQLNAGTFTLSNTNIPTINKSVVVRGQGPGVTIINRTNGAVLNNFNGVGPYPIFNMGGGVNYGSPVLLTQDAAKGDSTIHVASTTGIPAGTLVNVDELALGQAMPDCCFNSGAGQVWASPDYRYEWNAHSPAVAGNFDSACFDNSNFTNGGNCAAGGNHTDSTAYTIRAGGMNEEYHLVSSVGSGTITFDSPLTVPMRVANSAAITVFVAANEVPFVGLENLTMQMGGNGNLVVQGCIYCWATKVESYHYYNPGFDFAQGTFRFQLDNFWAHNGAWPVNGGGGYSIALDRGTSEDYIVNGISMLADKEIVMRASGAGSVVAYNYMDDTYISNNAGWVETGLNNSHLIGSHHSLFEGNVAQNVDADFTHGATSYATIYRNWLTGVRAPFTGEFDSIFRDDSTGCCSPLRAMASHPYTYRTSFVGNIAGKTGVTTTANGWVYSNNGGGGGSSGTSSMLKLGWNDVNTAGTNKDDVANVIYPSDPRSLCPGAPNCTSTWVTANGCMSNSSDVCTTIVDGNYDYVQGQVTWHQTQIALPNSFYLTSAPAFFTNFTWPPFDAAGGPRISDNPAHIRWLTCQPPTAACLFASTPQVSLTASPSTITTGQSSTLTWNSFNDTSCAGTGFSTGGATNGTVSTGALSPAGSYPFTVTCAGVPASATVTVNAPVASTWDSNHQGANTTLSSGNTIVTRNVVTGNAETFSTQQSSLVHQVNWLEIKCIATGTNNGFGVATSTTPNSYVGSDSASFGFYRSVALFQNANASNGWAGCVAGDTVGIKFDETVAPPTIAVAVLHAGTWGALSTPNNMGGSIGQGVRLWVVGDPEDNGDSLQICTHTACAASPSGIPAGAVWFDGF